MRFKGQNIRELKQHNSELVNRLAFLIEYDYPIRCFAYKLTRAIWAIKDEVGMWRFFATTY